jgi:putative transposase
MNHTQRKKMIDHKDKGLSLTKQCQVLNISRSSLYYQAIAIAPETLKIMKRMDEVFMLYPFFGSRQMARYLQREGVSIGRHRVRRLMRVMGLHAIYRKPNTSKPNPEHKIYPYLLRNLKIAKANHVWCADITYIPMQNGFLYLVAVMDWATRHVLSWRLSNSMDTSFCIEALQEAINLYGPPQIFNTDQGAQFTSNAFTGILREADIAISMDGRGRCMDNIFIERLWRSLKYESIYLTEMTDGFKARQLIGDWLNFYNTIRPHSSLDAMTPHEAYWKSRNQFPQAGIVKRAA